MPDPVHRLTGTPGAFAQATVACGARQATRATYTPALVTCRDCQRQCTCGPDLPMCLACRAFLTRHGRGTAPPAQRRFDNETAFQVWVMQQAEAAGFLAYHTHDSRHSPAGFPDLVAVKGEVLVGAELKMPGNRPSAAQRAWLEALQGVKRVAAHLWYPKDVEAILEVLRCPHRAVSCS